MRDIDIRRALRRDVDMLHGDDPDTVVIEELGLCQGESRVDLAVVNGTVHGYEIKSEHDTLARLPAQAQTYNRVFDYVTVIAAEAHASKVAHIVPPWWGISMPVTQSGDVRLRTARRACRNSGVDLFSLVQLLWRDEALEVLTNLGLASGMRSKRRQLLWRRLADEVPAQDLARIVREYLKWRGARREFTHNKREMMICPNLPPSRGIPRT